MLVTEYILQYMGASSGSQVLASDAFEIPVKRDERTLLTGTNRFDGLLLLICICL